MCCRVAAGGRVWNDGAFRDLMQNACSFSIVNLINQGQVDVGYCPAGPKH